MINNIVNNSLGNVQKSTSKVDSSQTMNSGFDILMNFAGAANNTDGLNKNSDVETAEIQSSTNDELETSDNNALVSILLLNNSFMQLINNSQSIKSDISDDSINTIISNNNLSGFSLDDVKQALEFIKTKLEGIQTNNTDDSFAMMQKVFDSNNTDLKSLTDNASKITDKENTSKNIAVNVEKSVKSNKQTPITDISANIISDNKTQINESTNTDKQSLTYPLTDTDTNANKNTNANKIVISTNAENVSKLDNEVKNNSVIKNGADTVNQIETKSVTETKASSPQITENINNSQTVNTVTKVNQSDSSVSNQNNTSIQESNSSLQSVPENSTSQNQSGNSGSKNSDTKKENQNIEKQVEASAISSNKINTDANTQSARVASINVEYDESGRVNVNDIPRYVNKLIKDMPTNSTQQAKLYLEPANLGKLTINITLTGNTATITFKADSKEAVQSIENQLTALKDKLSSNGIKIDSASVEQQTTNSNADTSGNQSNRGGSSEREQSEIKKEYFNTISGVALDNLKNDELPAQGNNKLNNSSLERYI